MDWKEVLGQLRDNPELPEGEEIATPEPKVAAKKETLHVIIDRKGRKGKVATIIEGFVGSDEEVAEVATMLKRRLGVGGSSRDGEILIQGDAAARVKDILKELGYKVK